MKILIVNPNSTRSMTEKIGAAARSVAAQGTEIVATDPPDSPVSIEGFADEALCVGPLLKVVREEAGNADAVVIACFGDPGLAACRVVTDRPVIGICEAAMLTASMVASNFSVVSTLARSVPHIEDLAIAYGMERKCRSVRACEVPVLSLQEPGSGAQDRVREEVKRAVAEDRAEAVLLGCAGMADLAASLTDELGIPVLDGVASATKLAEALAGLGVKTSKATAYAWPRDKSDVSIGVRHAAE